MHTNIMKVDWDLYIKEVVVIIQIIANDSKWRRVKEGKYFPERISNAITNLN